MESVHVSMVRVGDAIVCGDGKVRTVCANDIKHGFMGTSIFGDSYKCGTLSVKRIKSHK